MRRGSGSMVRHVLGSRARIPTPAGLIPLAGLQKRTFGYTHAIIRQPTKSAIPSVDIKGQPIESDEVFEDWDLYIKNCRQSNLFDEVAVLTPWPSWESMWIGDLLTQCQDCYLPMPRFGVEHRTQELNETMRWLSASGMRGTVMPVLQSDERSTAHAGDFVSTPIGAIVAQTSRTNSVAISLLKDKGKDGSENYAPFPIYTFNLNDDSAPPLGDFFGFGGQQTFFVWKTSYGDATIKFVTDRIKSRPWEFVRIEPGCNFLTFYGGHPRLDILVDEDYPNSIETMANAGFNPIPIKWKSFRRLGLTMRSATLCVKFSKGGYGGGGFHSHETGSRTKSRVVSSARSEQKIRGDMGVGSLHTQWRSGELRRDEIATPRYRPPMHRKSGIVVSDNQFGNAPVRQR